ncbi:hypothetical protein [Tenacibaculum crassostreae]
MKNALHERTMNLSPDTDRPTVGGGGTGTDTGGDGGNTGDDPK